MGNIKFNTRPNNKAISMLDLSRGAAVVEWATPDPITRQSQCLNVGSEQRSCCCGMGNTRPNNKAISMLDLVLVLSSTSPVDTSILLSMTCKMLIFSM